MTMEFKLNLTTKIAHYSNFSTEECNLDEAVELEDSYVIPEGYEICEHCSARKEKAIEEIKGQPD